ncbi:MAG: glycoside hydrolase family 2 TIM barrel-domain containing protein [Rikenellaceae bacterium]
MRFRDSSRAIIAAAIALCSITTTYAERVFRSEFAPYLTRQEAQIDARRSKSNYIALKPVSGAKSEGENGMAVQEHTQVLDLPAAWTEGSIFMHLENIKDAYQLTINGREVADIQDHLSPYEFDITKYIVQGKNTIKILTHPTLLPELLPGIPLNNDPLRERFIDCYLYTQERIHIFDYKARIVADKNYDYGWLEIEAIVKNGYNYPEVIDVGYDVYDPRKELVDYSVRKVKINGRSQDTIRWRTRVDRANSHRWTSANPGLFSVMLYTRSNSIIHSFISRRIGYTDRTFVNGDMYNFGEKETLYTTPYSAIQTTPAKIATELRFIRRRGFNTVMVSYPQPLWFYEICDFIGMYVIEQANINAAEDDTDRKIGGAPHNDPKLLDEYMSRTKSSYHRTRHCPSIIAHSLGSKSGNGYNMYKIYEWLKTSEDKRAIIYSGAEDEWNSDELNYILDRRKP